MMKKKNALVLLAGVIFGLNACGMSPELNHTYPKRTQANPLLGTANASTVQAEDGCELYFKTQNLCAKINWLVEPSRDAEGSFRLSFYSHDQGTAQIPLMVDPDAASVTVKLWMPDMGHGSGLVTVTHVKNETADLEDGIFDATRVYFVMPGKWDIVIQLKDERGQISDSAKIAYQAN